MDSTAANEELIRLATIATTRASEALALLVYEDIRVKGPNIYYLTSPEMLLLRLRSPRQLYSITQAVYGDEPGKVSLAFGRDTAPSLVDLLIGHRGTATRTLSGMELDALKETANILSGSYLANLAQPLKLTGAPSVPAIVEGPLEELVPSFLPQPRSLCVEARLMAPSRQVELVLLVAVGREQPVFQGSSNGHSLNGKVRQFVPAHAARP